ncbi:Drug resistance protein [Cyphellophora attinorum]|uniref:Drug resistance protein n=1 Tax=Cyphellophora attinorum TaxID=1664694 RepID=A0A0N1HZ63_9EURO|nr:Drug resistance protein [Phialophora attinorum]KPI43987.1 Drug resistance protein [Phialophora attinorum]
MTSAEISWLSAANNLAAGSFLLLFGRVADLFGRRWLLIAALASFAVFSIVAGFATNAVYLDVMSGLQGISCAAAVPPALGKLGGVYRVPSWRKNRAFACFSAGYPVGFVLGGFIAGVATDVGTWRVSFWAMGVLYAVFAVAAWWTVPSDGEQSLGGWNMKTLRQFDLVGAVLTVAGMGMFTASFTLTGDSEGGWREGYVLALLIVGAILIGTFIYWQSICRNPLMPLGVFKDRNFSILVFALCIGNLSFGGNLFWISLLWQRVERQKPLMVAVRLLPAGVGGIVVNAVAGLVMHKVSNKLLMVVGTASLVVASALWSATGPGLSYWALSFPALLCSVIGVDFQFTVTNMYVLSSMSSDQQSVAGGMFNTIARIASTIALGIQTAVYEGAGGTADGADALQYRPYQATFWFSLGATFLGLVAVPFLTIGTQGAKKKTP